MKLRLATLNTPLFDHEGMVLREAWSSVETDDLTPAGRAAIPKYRGHILQVHPSDVDAFDELVAILPTTPTHDEMVAASSYAMTGDLEPARTDKTDKPTKKR